LKQASLFWYRALSDFLESVGFERSRSDSCVFEKVEGSNVCFLAVYVDDVVLCSNSESFSMRFKRVLLIDFRCQRWVI
jgi:Reverse transcriptase (RNA-dependent DNA polymerase)